MGIAYVVGMCLWPDCEVNHSQGWRRVLLWRSGVRKHAEGILEGMICAIEWRMVDHKRRTNVVNIEPHCVVYCRAE